MPRNLTEKQQKFLDVLFEEAQGSPAKARKLAGYADGISSTTILNSLQDEVANLTKKFIATRGPQAAWSMVNVLNNPTDLGNKEKWQQQKFYLTEQVLLKQKK